MALVDYSSSAEDSSSDAGPPPAKRRKDAGHADRPGMPPLPSAFHDLYASTVRHSVVDDPRLHHGRTRQTPHVVGNWPSHLYVEWHPTTAQHELLKTLINRVRAELGSAELHDFLTSDLGAPLPLHISLSRPIALPTAAKDDFLEKITSAISSSGTGAFSVRPRALHWYRSPDSNRTFLILRVAGSGAADAAAASPNPQLAGLLARSNAVTARFGQPELYNSGGGGGAVGDAFHVSVGWTFEPPGDEGMMGALDVFGEEGFAEVRRWEVGVEGVKVKIGNVVNHISLRSGKAKELGSLFGP